MSKSIPCPDTDGRSVRSRRPGRVPDGDATEAVWEVRPSSPRDLPLPDLRWTDEAARMAWIDQATGLDCIVRRERAGHLGGYVGVAPSHPLHGYGHRAASMGFDIEVHGGLSYSRPCDDRGPPTRRICHVVEAGGPHSFLWWFGFECDRVYDVVPGRTDHGAALGVVQSRRDEQYVYLQTVQLAAQLHAIGRGEPKPDLACPPPPLGLEHAWER